jgi:hypothetical protein
MHPEGSVVSIQKRLPWANLIDRYIIALVNYIIQPEVSQQMGLHWENSARLVLVLASHT